MKLGLLSFLPIGTVALAGSVAASQVTLDLGFRGALLDTNSTRSSPPFDSETDFYFSEPPDQFADWTVGASAQITDASASVMHASSTSTDMFFADVTVAASRTANPGAYNEFLSYATSSYGVNFSIAQTTEFVLNGSLFAGDGSGASLQIIGLGGGGVLHDFDTDAGVFSMDQTIALGAGSYSFRAVASSSFVDATQDSSGTAGFQFTFQTVPAPAGIAAFAFLACATTRRRQA